MTDFQPHIGKKILETLTLGMYEDSRFIYREYVQNAADQIDVAVEEGILNQKKDGQINIEIDKINRTISIQDNATGIRSKDALKFLGDVANSQKDPDKRKGFRGIGRLGGLGYCKKLIFETSYKGETIKSIITLDAQQLKELIENKDIVMDASKVISVITSLRKEPEVVGSHYFNVTLEEVTNDNLLDVNNVKQYLSLVAPIPFSPEFPFTEKIHSYFKENNIKIDEYDVHLNINNEKLFKPYKASIYDKRGDMEILDVNFMKFYNDEDELLAIIWYGISDKLNVQISTNNIERGLRLRKDNIGIGSEFTLSKLFGQSRQNLNYIGEVHAISSGFIPNARRDYFNDTKTCKTFEQELRQFFPKLGSLTQDSSKLHNRKNDIEAYNKELENFRKKSQRENLTIREEQNFKDKLIKLEKKAVSSKKVIERIQKKAINDRNLHVVYENIIGDFETEINKIEQGDKGNGSKGNFDFSLKKLDKNEQRIVFEIFEIIEKNLSLTEAEKLKKKIAEHYN